MAKEIKIKVTQVKDVTSKTTGQKFKAYTCVGADGKLMDLKFTAECHNKPTAPCWIYCDADNVNVSRRTEYPVTWVKEVNRIAPLSDGKTNAAEYFAAADETDEEVF